MARILHISDLHVADAHVRTSPRTLEQVWHPANTHLRDEKFDFVVVSGDLTDRATQKEYEALRDFACNRLLKRLVQPHRSRIIFVPGNHDVQWDDGQFEPVRLEHQEPEHLSVPLRDAQRAPERSGNRLNVTRYGHVEVLKVKKADYAARMANVQSFLTKFYDGALADNSRPFALDRAGEDWSCHAFCEEG